MKKKIVVVVAIAFSIALLGSCKSTHHCAAYSQVDVEQTATNV